MRLGPLPAGGIGYCEPGQVGCGVPRVSVGLGNCVDVPCRARDVRADVCGFELGFPFPDLCLDIGRRQGCGAVVLVTAASSSPRPIAFSRAASSGSCRARTLAWKASARCAYPAGTGPIAT